MKTKIKLIFAALFLTYSISAFANEHSKGLTHFVESRNIVAAVSWDNKNACSFGLSTVITTVDANAGAGIGGDIISNCPDSNENKFYSPTAFIFKNKTGELKRTIQFFGEECPYEPIALSVKGKKITMTVQLLTSSSLVFGVGSDLFTDNYPDCQYPGEITTIRETRNIKTGELIKKIVLQNHRVNDLP